MRRQDLEILGELGVAGLGSVGRLALTVGTVRDTGRESAADERREVSTLDSFTVDSFTFDSSMVDLSTVDAVAFAPRGGAGAGSARRQRPDPRLPRCSCSTHGGSPWWISNTWPRRVATCMGSLDVPSLTEIVCSRNKLSRRIVAAWAASAWVAALGSEAMPSALRVARLTEEGVR